MKMARIKRNMTKHITLIRRAGRARLMIPRADRAKLLKFCGMIVRLMIARAVKAKL